MSKLTPLAGSAKARPLPDLEGRERRSGGPRGALPEPRGKDTMGTGGACPGQADDRVRLDHMRVAARNSKSDRKVRQPAQSQSHRQTSQLCLFPVRSPG